jgi:hypothetical protein
MSDIQPNGENAVTRGRRDNVGTYARLIERYLANETVPHSESEIAKAVLKVALDTDDDIPSSAKDLDKLTEIKESLRMLISQKKIFQSLILDPQTKEETVYYSFRRQTTDA